MNDSNARLWVFIVILILCVMYAACTGNTGNTNSTANSNATANTNAAANIVNTAAQTPAPKNEYPQNTVEAFLDSCEEAGSEREFCSCVLDKVREKYTFAEFSVIESKLAAGQPPQEFVEFTGKARAECTK
jgi:hypothetical protein